MSDSPASARTAFGFRSLLTLARVYAVSRIAIGIWLLVDPDGFGHKWLAASDDPFLTGSLIRGSGGRDLGIGLGLLFAASPRPWLLLCAFCDALDAGLVFVSRSRFAEGDVVQGMVGATSYAAIGVALAIWAARKPASTPARTPS